MRKTRASGGKTLSTTSLSSRALLSGQAERLLDHDPAPAALLRRRQARNGSAARRPGEGLPAGSTGRTHGCRRCRARRPVLRRVPARPNARRRRRCPGTNRNPPEWSQVPSGKGVRRTRHTASWTMALKSSSAQSRRANPTRLKEAGRQSPVGQVVDGGISFLAGRSPVTPKSPGQGRRSAATPLSRNGLPSRLVHGRDSSRNRREAEDFSSVFSLAAVISTCRPTPPASRPAAPARRSVNEFPDVLQHEELLTQVDADGLYRNVEHP